MCRENGGVDGEAEREVEESAGVPGMIITKAWAMPNAQTFLIPPIKEILIRYVGNGIGWVDPYAGGNSPAQFRNDLLPKYDTEFVEDALVFCRDICPHIKPNDGFAGVIFDPPYSYRQVSEHYKEVGKKATSMDTSANFYNRVMNAICDQIKPGGYTFHCGWNTNAFGKNRGFEQIEIRIVAHGGHHHDTLVTVEQKL